ESAVLSPGSEVNLGSVTLRLELTDLLDLPLASHGYRGLLGRSPSMLKLFAILQRLEGSLVNVLLEGESGTGKELVARAIHEGSSVSAGQFVAVNCAALDRELVKSELFGHRRGAFTGASETRPGAFELADGGTLFLDEVGELPLDVQPILLRALETREVARVGENLPRAVNVRVIAATNKNLDEARRRGNFREDLFFRLAVVRLELPSLAQRRQDIRILASAFAQKAGGAVLPEDFLVSLENQSWTGNARELRNAVEAYLAIGLLTQAAKGGGELDAPLESWVDPTRAYSEQKDELLAAFTRIYLQRLLEHTGGNQSEAARIAGLERSYLGKLASKLGVKR
ncbi:MAG: sigma-54-dependent Fis family transcriptional regulator, partial [Myxococcales bacterium]|nr:sigma-54-dependent Fis family transcriptional regulator [Myxococcales bacterium]